MKIYKLFLLACFSTLSIYGFGQADESQYDAELATKLGADEYGMKNYFFVLLKTGEAEISDKDSLNLMFAGHFENITAMAESGNLIVAGPFMQNERAYRGLFIIEATDEKSLRAMLNRDPTISNGIFEAEITPWYGSAALGTYIETHRKIEKLKPGS